MDPHFQTDTMVTDARARRRIVYGVSLVVVGIYAALGPSINPAVAVGAPLRIDLTALALLGLLAFLPGRERGGGWAAGSGDRAAGFWDGRARSDWVRGLVPWIVSGGLLGAALVAPWAAFPWLVVPAMAVAWAGKGGGLGPRRGGAGGDPAQKAQNRRRGFRRAGVAVALLACLANCGLVAMAFYPGSWITPEEFATQDFRVNGLLADVPPHDVLAMDLKGHASPTLEELGNAFRSFSPFQVTPVVMALGMLREVMVFALGVDDPRWSDANMSFVHRLTEADRLRSTTEPGTAVGMWRVLYACPLEGVAETINGTVHVAVAATIGEGPSGPRLFVSFHVREVNWTTRWYMRLIDPSRRYFVYPFLLRQFAHIWEREGWKPPEDSSMGEGE